MHEATPLSSGTINGQAVPLNWSNPTTTYPMR
jgi:hypothetical protein